MRAQSDYPNNYADYDIDPCEDTIDVSFDEDARAGQFITMKITITLAEALAEGEAIALMTPYGFTPPQITLPASPGYTTVTTSSQAALRLASYAFGKLFFERGVIAWVEDGEVAKGEKVTFTYGDTSLASPGVCASVQAHKGLLVGCYRIREKDNPHPPIQKESPRIAVGSASAVLVRGFITPTLVVGEKGRLTLVAEDACGNRVEDFTGKVHLRGINAFDGVPEKFAFALADAGKKEIPFTAKATGLSRPVVRYRGVDVVAGPVEVTKDVPQYRLYFGEIHVHSELSYDAAGSLDELYTFGRDTACLDFAAATDHMVAITGRPGCAEHYGSIPGIRFERFKGRWQATIDACKRYNEPGRFVTFLGFEFDTYGHTGHRNLYFKNDDVPPIEAPQWPAAESAMAEWAKGKKDIMLIPHHPPIFWGQGVSNHEKGLEIETISGSVQPFVEIYSKHGTSEFLNNPRPLRGQIPGYFVQDMLEAGAHVGFVGGSDSHQANPGSSLTEPGPYRTLQYRSGLACVWAKDLTRESLWEAFFARRVYATSYPRAILKFWVNDLFMGEIGQESYPRTLRVFIVAPTFVNQLEVIKNGKQILSIPKIQTGMPCDIEGEYTFTDEDKSDRDEDYYYIRVTLHNGERIWSSPVWVKE